MRAADGMRGVGTVQLVWPGRTWSPRQPPGRTREGKTEARTPSRAASHGSSRPLALIDVTRDGAQRVIHGDTLDLVDALEGEGVKGKVDLVYVDPPYASDRDYVAESRLDGPADGRVVRSPAYADTWKSKDGGLGAYLDMLAPRLDGLASLLSKTGSIWVHVDWRASYLVRALLDEILGRDAFLNEIVWRRAPNLGRQATSGQFGRTLDTIVVYGGPDATLRPPTRLEPIEENAIRYDDQGRAFTSAPRGDYTDASIAKLDKEGRIHRTASGRVYIKYFLVKNDEGVLCRERRVDALWTDVPPLRHAPPAERTGYPTQKPRALLERILRAATDAGSIVVDGFAGSGTTAVAAHALGRRAIVCDRSAVAIATARTRLLREGAGLRIERAPGASVPKANEVVRVAKTASSVVLEQPKEPLAWAIGHVEDGAFYATWHAERGLGARAVPADAEAPLASLGGIAERAGASVRVWSDDGSASTVPLETTMTAKNERKSSEARA